MKAVKETVSKTISQVINADVSNDIIIPICGKLANDVSYYTLLLFLSTSFVFLFPQKINASRV